MLSRCESEYNHRGQIDLYKFPRSLSVEEGPLYPALHRQLPNGIDRPAHQDGMPRNGGNSLRNVVIVQMIPSEFRLRDCPRKMGNFDSQICIQVARAFLLKGRPIVLVWDVASGCS